MGVSLIGVVGVAVVGLDVGLAVVFILFTIRLAAIAFIIAAITIMVFFFIEYMSHIEAAPWF